MVCLNPHSRKGQQAVTGGPRLWAGDRCYYDMVLEGGQRVVGGHGLEWE